ncbi:MAG TPA: 3-hydroxyacyl-CoA dehydrogenase family protein [Thermoanaerobaculia bacterium]|nr:3-hydroxyacyl-CoA dehydrogenase family protein [Thermoanaerobaculia bacterium]
MAQTVLIVGGGTMGRGIAGVCALAGFDTTVAETDRAARERLVASIEASWKRAVEAGKLDAAKAHSAAGRLATVSGPADAPEAAIAIEAVPESLELKERIFRELDRLLPKARFLATNTSSLSIAAIARSTATPGRVVGVHFFNPVAVMPLVEVVHGPETLPETVAAAEEFAATLGKRTIRVRDAPGFASSRLGIALGLEAMRMVEEGIASPADIDRAMELGYGHPMGPLKTSDLVGLDVRLAIAEALAAALDPVRFDPPRILRDLVSQGRTGKKSGRGFYVWEGDRPREE